MKSNTAHAMFTSKLGSSYREETVTVRALKVLKDKFSNSPSCKASIDDMFKTTAEQKDRFGPPMEKLRELYESFNLWTTSIPKLLKPTKKDNQNQMYWYRLPQTNATLLTNYMNIAYKDSVEKGGPCGKSVLCNRGEKGGKLQKNSFIK